MSRPGLCDQEYDKEKGCFICQTCGWEFHLEASRKCPNKKDPDKTKNEGVKMPSAKKQAWNLISALGDFVSDGCKLASNEEYKKRLEICDTCPRRRGNRCSKCGCNLKAKARGRAFKCPEGKWDAEPRPEPPKAIEKYNKCKSCKHFIETSCNKRGPCTNNKCEENVWEFIVESDISCIHFEEQK